LEDGLQQQHGHLRQGFGRLANNLDREDDALSHRDEEEQIEQRDGAEHCGDDF